MAMSNTLKTFLDSKGVGYELVPHARSFSSTGAAAAAHVPGDRLAKTVVVEDGDGEHFVGVVVPSTRYVDLAAVRERLGHQCGLATEDSVERLFDDCETGAIPALPQAYGMDVLVDDALEGLDDIYFAAGDHGQLAHLSGEDFAKLMSGAPHGKFTARGREIGAA